MVDGTLRIMVPATLPPEDEAKWVSQMQARVWRKLASSHVDLDSRAAMLSKRFDLPRPTAITWSDRQEQRWGSCTGSRGTIRISRRLGSVPTWVLDYVIVHELAHLQVAGHGPEFRTLVERYPKSEVARGYLMAVADLGG